MKPANAKGRLKQHLKRPGSKYCKECKKIAHPTLEAAQEVIEIMKAESVSHAPYLLDAYRCPKGSGWHIGHNYKLQFLSLCIGEHK